MIAGSVPVETGAEQGGFGSILWHTGGGSFQLAPSFWQILLPICPPPTRS
jgi:hypothetical protein